MAEIFAKTGQQLLISLIVLIVIILLIKAWINHESEDEKLLKIKQAKKLADEIKITEQREIDRQQEMTNYLKLKRNVENFNDDEMVTFMNSNIKQLDNWNKLEAEIKKVKYISQFETSNYLITKEFYSTSDTMCIFLKNKITGKILRKWCYGYD